MMVKARIGNRFLNFLQDKGAASLAKALGVLFLKLGFMSWIPGLM